MTDSHSEIPGPRSWTQEFLDRRVPQVLGLYMGASWAIIQFVQWLVVRYELAPDLDHVAFVTCLSLIPSIVLLTWFHGHRAHPGRWTRVEKVGIPLNLVLTGALLLLVIRGDDADAATRTLVLTDEEGRQVERVVPKQEYRKSVLIFGLENRTGDADLDWLEDGIPVALGLDLQQSLFIDSNVSALSDLVLRRLQREGFQSDARMPLALKREVAKSLHMDHFAAGTFTRAGDDLAASFVLYETSTGKPFAEHDLEAPDVFTLADEMTRRWKEDLGIPEAEVDAAEDLPAGELLTSSPEAYELLIRGLRKHKLEQDAESARSFLRQAIALDETFALAHFVMADVCLGANDSECAMASIEATMRYSYRLPESLKFAVKDGYYLFKGDLDKRVGLLEMRVEMFPDDPEPLRELGWIHARNNRHREAIAAFERALEVSPANYDIYLDLGNSHLSSGETEKAREDYEAYVRQYPNEARSYRILGTFLERIAEYDGARDRYEKALLLEPGSIGLMLDLGDVARSLGQFDEARRKYEEALDSSRDAQERFRAHERLQNYFEHRGQLSKALVHLEASLRELESYSTELDYLIARIFKSDLYITYGDERKAWESLKTVEESIAAPFDRIVIVGYLKTHMAKGDIPAVEERLEKLDQVIESLGGKIGGLPRRKEILLAKLAEAKGNLEEALSHYRQVLELNTQDFRSRIDVLRCERRLGRFEEAARTRAELLRLLPHDGGVHLEAALLYADTGERERAAEHLEKALEVWAEADPEFEPAREARTKLGELTQLS